MDIEVTNVAKRYGTSLAVSDVSFGVEQGQVLSLLGPSGCGKTTVMRMIAGLIAPSAGAIAIKGQPVNRIPVHKRNVGMLFQNYALFPHLDVARNIAFGLEMRGLSKADAVRKAQAALAMVRLDGFGARFPHQLSGGQQQRVALARALVIEPAVLLLDEPFGALDKKLRENMQIELRLLQSRLGITTVMVTHDQDEALTLADRIAVMRDGVLEQVGTPGEVYRQPVSRFVASFIGVSNFFRGKVQRSGGELAVASDAGPHLTINGGQTALADRATVALRPHLVWGPGDKNVVPRVLALAKAGRLKIIGAGRNKVDVTHITNVVDAHLLAEDALGSSQISDLKSQIRPAGGKAYFITNGEPVVLWDWINQLLCGMGLPEITKHVPLPAAYAAGGLMEALWRTLPLQGEPPSTVDPPSGCPFRTRCPIAQGICAQVMPPVAEVRPSHFVACHFPGQF